MIVLKKVNGSIKIIGVQSNFNVGTLSAVEDAGKVAIRETESETNLTSDLFSNYRIAGSEDLIGANSTEVVDFLNSFFNFSMLTTTINANTEKEIDIESINVLEVSEIVPGESIENVPTSTIDPTNVSTLDARLIDRNENTFCYNNSSPGTFNKPLPALDLGSVKSVSSVKLIWFTTGYIPTSYKLQYSYDGVNFTDIISVNTINNLTQIIQFEKVQCRYIRIFCVSGVHPSWVVVREMFVYAPPTELNYKRVESSSNIELWRTENGKLIVKNLTEGNINVSIKHL